MGRGFLNSGDRLYYRNKYSRKIEYVRLIRTYHSSFDCLLPDGRIKNLSNSLIGESLFPAPCFECINRTDFTREEINSMCYYNCMPYGLSHKSDVNLFVAAYTSRCCYCDDFEKSYSEYLLEMMQYANDSYVYSSEYE